MLLEEIEDLVQPFDEARGQPSSADRRFAKPAAKTSRQFERGDL
jgi:hypothetical protein